MEPSASIRPARYLISVSVNFILAPLRANPSFWFALTSQLFRIYYHTKLDVQGLTRSEIRHIAVEGFWEQTVMQVHENELAINLTLNKRTSISSYKSVDLDCRFSLRSYYTQSLRLDYETQEFVQSSTS